MVQIPTSRDVAYTGTRSGRISPSGPSVSVGAAVANAGQNIVQAAYDLNDLRTGEKNDLQAKAGFDLETKITQFRDAEEQAFNKAKEDSSESGIGFTRQFIEGYQGRVNNLIKENFGGLTEAQNAQARQTLLGLGNSLYGKSYAYEQQAKTNFYDRTTNSGLDTIRTQIRNNAAPYEELKKQGLAAIDSANMPEPWKAERRALWDADAAESKWRWKYAQDPQGAIGALRGSTDPSGILSAIRGVESENNPNAESSKGASGLMQVMPETGVEIAQELGDAAFPVNGTEAEKKAYLKDPEVSNRYGEHYYNKMLSRYDGDQEAALIAYNGGAERADAWLESGRDDSVIPAESAAYYKKVLGRAKTSIPFTSEDALDARVFLRGKTNKDASHISGLKDVFAVKLSRLIQAAPEEIRAGLGIYSGARSVERQAELWQEALKKYGSAEAARKWVAPPGKSNHNHGDAADLSFNGQSLRNAPEHVVKWVHENAAAFGLKFPLANENWHIEDDSTRGGRKTSQGDFASIPYERREQLAAWGEGQYNQQRTQERAAARDNYSLLIATQPDQVSPEVILRDNTLDNGDKAALINSLRTARKEGDGVNQFIAAMGAGDVSVNPYDADQKKVANKAYEKMLGAVDPEQQATVTSGFVASTGYIPEKVQADLRRGSASTDPSQVAQAMEAATVLQKNAPISFSAFDGSAAVTKNLDLYKSYTQSMGYTPDEAAKKIIAASDPEQIRRRDAIIKSEPVKKLLKGLSSSNVAAIFDKGVFSAAPDVGAGATTEQIQVGVNPEAEAAIVSDYRNVFEEALVDANGDQGAAEEIAKRRFQTMYGTTEFSPLSSNIVVRYPPEKAYPAMAEGGHDYIREQLAEAMKAEGIEADALYLQGDNMTEQDIKAGKPARYQVFYEQDGKLQRYNLPFYADVDAAKASTKAKQADAIKAAEERMLQNRTEEGRRFPEGRGTGRAERFGNDELYRGIARDNSPLGRAIERRLNRPKTEDQIEREAWDALSPEEQRSQSLDNFLDGPFQKRGNR